MNEEAIRVVREIEKKYEALWGEIQPCCHMYQNYCVCKNQETPDQEQVTTE